MSAPRRRFARQAYRTFASSSRRSLVRNVSELPDRTVPRYVGAFYTFPGRGTRVKLTGPETSDSDALGLQWPAPPRNVLLVKKSHSVAAKQALLEFAACVEMVPDRQ